MPVGRMTLDVMPFKMPVHEMTVDDIFCRKTDFDKMFLTK